jgi:hypothetical protein
MTNWTDTYKVTRRLMVALSMWATWEVSTWAMWFCVGNSRNGMEIAAIVAAVTSPVMAMTAVVFRAYVDGDKV